MVMFGLVERAFQRTFWAAPLASIIANVLIAWALCAVDIAPSDYQGYRPDGKRGYSVFFFAGTSDGARALLGMVSGASISAVTLTFSLTVLSLQLAATNYSPRILDEFVKDPIQKLTLSTYLGTFAYCFIVMANVQSETSTRDAYIPIVAVNALIFHMFAVLMIFVLFLHHFISNMRVEMVLGRSQRAAMKVLRRMPRAKAVAFDEDNRSLASTASGETDQGDDDGLPEVRLSLMVDRARRALPVGLCSAAAVVI